MKIVETIKLGFHYGAFTAAAIVVPVAIMGAAYGCYKVVSKINERRKTRSKDAFECVDFREVE